MTLELLTWVTIEINPYIFFLILCTVVGLYSIKKHYEYERLRMNTKAQQGQHIY